MRIRAALGIALLWVHVVGVGVAQSKPHAGALVVLPPALSGAEVKGLAIYSQPIANALATQLREALRRDVRTAPGADAVEPGVAWVVHARLIGGDGWLQLEARLRDPGRGRSTRAVTTERAPPVRVDVLTVALGQKLARLVSEIESVQDKPYRLDSVLVRVDPLRDRRPAVSIRVTGDGGLQGVLKVDEPASLAAVASLRRLGYKAWPASARRQDDAPVDYTLELHIKKIRFFWDGVLAARGTLQLHMAKNGVQILAHEVTTGTVVGDRGDRHSVLLRLLVEQAIDIAGTKLAVAAL